MLSDGLHTYAYDGENRVSAVKEQNVSYQYDAESKRVATLNGNAVMQEYLYDTAGDLVTTVDTSGHVGALGFTGGGRALGRLDRRGGPWRSQD